MVTKKKKKKTNTENCILKQTCMKETWWIKHFTNAFSNFYCTKIIKWSDIEVEMSDFKFSFIHFYQLISSVIFVVSKGESMPVYCSYSYLQKIQVETEKLHCYKDLFTKLQKSYHEQHTGCINTHMHTLKEGVQPCKNTNIPPGSNP